MRMKKLAQYAGILSLLCLLAGCVTQGKAVWNARVGNYTFDQAVLEFGPPDKTARLTDGTGVHEWLTMRGHSGRAVAMSTGYYPSASVWMEPSSPDVYLRLTFGPDGRLREWRKVVK